MLSIDPLHGTCRHTLRPKVLHRPSRASVVSFGERHEPGRRALGSTIVRSMNIDDWIAEDGVAHEIMLKRVIPSADLRRRDRKALRFEPFTSADLMRSGLRGRLEADWPSDLHRDPLGSPLRWISRTALRTARFRSQTSSRQWLAILRVERALSTESPHLASWPPERRVRIRSNAPFRSGLSRCKAPFVHFQRPIDFDPIGSDPVGPSQADHP